ncbi:MAG TPA: alpha/beta fold hydrolase [Mycobacteriales bacterium]|nr:alpha/beta fold hydrolase [Mycobacteriales bacterium]
MPTLGLPGTKLHYEVSGAGVPVMLIHGMGLDGRMWEDQVAALSDLAELARPDLRGFGRSPRDSDVAYSHAADVWALADHLGWDDAVIVGLSMGGMVALETVLAAPSRVRALVVMDGVIDGVPFDEPSKAMIAALFQAASAGDLVAAKKVWFDCGFFAPARRDAVVAKRLEQMVADFSGRDWLGDDPHEPRPKLFPLLPEIQAPTTVVVGDLDVPCFRAMADEMASRIPGARKVVVPDAGHMVNMEAPDAVNDVLREVIAVAA